MPDINSIGPRVLAALIGGLVTVAGGIVTYLSNREDLESRIADQLRDDLREQWLSEREARIEAEQRYQEELQARREAEQRAHHAEQELRALKDRVQRLEDRADLEDQQSLTAQDHRQSS